MCWIVSLEMLLLGTGQNIPDGGDERRTTNESELTFDRAAAELREGTPVLRSSAQIAIWRRSRPSSSSGRLALNRAMLPSTSRARADVDVPHRCEFAIASRYSRTVSVTMARRAVTAAELPTGDQ
jgi:hypothetical protein